MSSTASRSGARRARRGLAAVLAATIALSAAAITGSSAGAASRRGSGAVDKAGAQTYERSLRPAEKVHEPWIERCRIQMEAALAVLESAAADRGPGTSWTSRPDA